MLSKEERHKSLNAYSFNMPKGKSKWFYINKTKKKQKRKKSEAAKKGWKTRKRNQRKKQR